MKTTLWLIVLGLSAFYIFGIVFNYTVVDQGNDMTDVVFEFFAPIDVVAQPNNDRGESIEGLTSIAIIVFSAIFLIRWFYILDGKSNIIRLSRAISCTISSIGELLLFKFGIYLTYAFDSPRWGIVYLVLYVIGFIIHTACMMSETGEGNDHGLFNVKYSVERFLYNKSEYDSYINELNTNYKQMIS